MESSYKIKNICVFCSSSNHLDNKYFKLAENLGQLIARNNWSLVYGGTNVGLMGRLAEASQNYGNPHITGVIPQRIFDKGIANDACDELIITSDMYERKKVMASKSDAFVAMPGGFGTLEEILEVLTLKQLQYLSGPVVFLNVEGFYCHLEKMFATLFQKGFSNQKYRSLYYMAPDLESMEKYLIDYNLPSLTDKWSD